MAWMIREDKLDPEQRDFINSEYKKDGNIWVRGFAGSGKSVLLVHALKNILNKEPNANVCIVVYTRSLINLFETGFAELNLPKHIPMMTYIEFCSKDTKNYDYILCDEVQDLPQKALDEMQRRGKKIIVAGDSNQSIYDKDPRWKESIVNSDDIGKILNARQFQLNIIHRLTRSIISAIQKLIPNMNIWGSKRDLTKQDVNIRLCKADKIEDEVTYIYEEAKKYVINGDSCAILLPNHEQVMNFVNIVSKVNKIDLWEPVLNNFMKTDYGQLNHYFYDNKIKLDFVGNGYGSLLSASANQNIILMTYYSAKGLDFDNVFLPFIDNNLYLPPQKAQTLFMVAMTRSKKNLYITYTNKHSNYVDKFKEECTEISISNLNKKKEKVAKEVFDF